MKILEKDKKKKIREHVCVNVTCLVYCMTAHLTMTASLIIALELEINLQCNNTYMMIL